MKSRSNTGLVFICRIECWDNYLNKRNLTEDEIKKFKIGYVEKNGNYYEKLREKHNEKVLKDCGLFYFDEKKR